MSLNVYRLFGTRFLIRGQTTNIDPRGDAAVSAPRNIIVREDSNFRSGSHLSQQPAPPATTAVVD